MLKNINHTLFIWFCSGCIFFLGFVGSSFADQQPLQSPSADCYQKGLAAFQAGDYATACPLLEQACAARPNDAQLLLNLAISQFQTKQFTAAESSYRTLYQQHPDDPRIAFELGRTLTACGKYKEAEELFQNLRQKGAPPELQNGLDTMLDQLAELKKRTKVGGSVQISYLSDDNVNVGPNDSSMGNITLDPGTLPKETTGYGYAFMVGIDHKLDEQGLWSLSGGISRNEIQYTAHSQYDVAVMNLSLRLGRKLEKGSLQAALNYTDIDQGEMNSINTFSPSVMWMHGLDQRTQLISDASIEYRDNRKSCDSNSVYVTLGEYLRWFYGENNANYILGGVRLFDEDARSPKNSNTGFELKLAPSFALPWKLRLDTAATWGMTNYEKPPSTLAEEDRKDQKYTLSGSLSRTLWSESVTATLNLSHTKNRSNYVPNDYDKNTVKCTLSYSF